MCGFQQSLEESFIFFLVSSSASVITVKSCRVTDVCPARGAVCMGNSQMMI